MILFVKVLPELREHHMPGLCDRESVQCSEVEHHPCRAVQSAKHSKNRATVHNKSE
jgi:hypothetical protein